MRINSQDVTEVRSEDDLILVRSQVKLRAKEIGFSTVNQTKCITVASELGRNMLLHGLGGVAKLEYVIDLDRQGLRMIFVDTGPGISDIEQAMVDGYTSKRGMGLGLGGSKRLMDEFNIISELGRGTSVTVVKWA